LKAIEFNEKMGKNIHSRLFLLSFNSKLSHFDKNLNLNHKWFSPTWRKPIPMALFYGEALGHSELATVKGFLKRYFPMHEPL
jgi:hypothetical protein